MRHSFIVCLILCFTSQIDAYGQDEEQDAREAFRDTTTSPSLMKLDEAANRPLIKTYTIPRQIPQVVYVPRTVRYGLFGKKCRVVYVRTIIPRTVYEQAIESLIEIDWGDIDSATREYAFGEVNLGTIPQVAGAKTSKISSAIRQLLTGDLAPESFDDDEVIVKHFRFSANQNGTPQQLYKVIVNVRPPVAPSGENELIVRVAVAARDEFGVDITDSMTLKTFADSKLNAIETALEEGKAAE